MDVLVRDNIGLREFARRAEALRKLVEKGEVEIDACIGGAVERPGRRLAFAAAGRRLGVVEGEGGRLEGHALRVQDRRPTVFGGADNAAGELEGGIVGARAVLAGRL